MMHLEIGPRSPRPRVFGDGAVGKDRSALRHSEWGSAGGTKLARSDPGPALPGSPGEPQFPTRPSWQCQTGRSPHQPRIPAGAPPISDIYPARASDHKSRTRPRTDSLPRPSNFPGV